MSEIDWVKLLSVAENQKLVLEIGGFPKPQAHLVPSLEDSKIIHLNIDPEQYHDILADAADALPELYGKYDAIFASHILEHYSYWDTEKVLRHWMDWLKDGGSLHIVVPSWEWAAREVLSEKPSPALFGHCFAGNVNEWDVHKCMFTLRNLRRIFEHIGLNVVAARTGQYFLHFNGTNYPAEQHYIYGVKGTPQLEKT